VRRPASRAAARPGHAAARRRRWIVLSAALLAGTARAGPFDGPLSFGGDLAVTSDYFYRGLSQSNGNPAVQGDLHVSDGGLFAGVWASTRNPDLIPYANYDLEVYLGKRFEFGSEWSGGLSARVEVGYYFAQNEAQEIYPYPPPTRHIAGTLSWRF